MLVVPHVIDDVKLRRVERLTCVLLPHLPVISDESRRGREGALNELAIFNLGEFFAVVIIISRDGEVSRLHRPNENKLSDRRRQRALLRLETF